MPQLPEHFCVVPFVHFSCKPDGSSRLCNYSSSAYNLGEDGEKLNLAQHSIDEIWHSKWMNNIRMRMLSDQMPPECVVCQKEGASGKETKRSKENKKYLHKAEDIISYAQKNAGEIKTSPVHFDLRMGNLCNLKCRTCNPLFSSTWESEVKAHPGNKVFEIYQGHIDRVRENKLWHKDPEVWAQFHKIAAGIEEIYLTGGEPMMIKEHYSLLKFLSENDYAKNIILRYSTNLTMLPDEFLKYTPHFKKVSLSCSIDGYGERNDWLRSPSQWSRIMENFNKAMALPDSVRIDVNATLSIFNVYYYDELFLFFKNLSKVSGKKIDVYTDVLYEPDFMQMKLLPKHLKDKTKAKLLELTFFKGISELEKKNIYSIIKVLEVEDEFVDQKRAKLRQHIVEIDKIRNEDFVTVFPELSELVAPDLLSLCTPPFLGQAETF